MGEIHTASTPRRDEVIKPLRNPVEIADAVPVRVLERPRIHLVDHAPSATMRPPSSVSAFCAERNFGLAQHPVASVLSCAPVSSP